MRIIAGEFRSRQLKSITGSATRPTPDRLRETLFDILAAQIAGVTFVDAYAGTGAIGLEAISRGASHVFLLERNRAALTAIHDNIASLGVEGRATAVPGPVLRNLARHRAQIYFLDPPYDNDREYRAALELLGQAGASLVIAQHSVRLDLLREYGVLRLTRTVRQGDNQLSFYASDSPVSS